MPCTGSPRSSPRYCEPYVSRDPGATDILAIKGMVRREPPRRDRRQCHCFLNKAGLEALERVESVVAQSCVDLLSSLSEGQENTLNRILRVLRREKVVQA